MTEETRKPQISWVQASAGALAAMSSAVLLSTFGVAGTIIGAALGSVVLTVGNAIYSHYLDVSRERLAAASARVARARASVRGASGDVGRAKARADKELAQADDELQQAEEELADTGVGAGGVRWREILVGLPWKRISLAAAGLFVVAMSVILVFELVAGRAVSTFTGGTRDDGVRTSIPGWGSRDSGGEQDERRSPERQEDGPASTPGEGQEPTDAPTATEEESVPSEEPTTSAAPTTAVPTTGPPTTAEQSPFAPPPTVAPSPDTGETPPAE